MSILAGAVSLLLLLAAVLLAVPVLMFCLQIAAAFLPDRRGPDAAPRPPIAVLVPAHNEALGITGPLQAMLAQMRPGDRLLVVADNCSDDTAAVARAAGAEVIERSHATERGKGYALAYGVDHLRRSPPPVVVIVDADCLPRPGAFDALSAACLRWHAPVQAKYLMTHEQAPGLNGRIAEFAWRVKNWIRPRGSARLGWPCQLTGSGMALPWPLIETAPLATGSIVEDMRLGLLMARAGHAPRFCESARVDSHFPTQAAAITSQRTRWEHGHLGMLTEYAGPLVGLGLRQRDWRLLGMGLDLLVPPLALLVIVAIVLWLLTAAAALVGAGAWAWHAVSGLILLLAAAVGLGWWRWGRDLLSAMDLARAPVYALSKLLVYVRFWSRRQKDWVRTDRN